MKLRLKAKKGFEPVRAHSQDAGMDLKVDLPSKTFYTMRPGEEVKFGTGVSLEVPEGYVALAASRSGLKVQLANSLGVIDSGYQGEVFVRLFNHNEPYTLKHMDRVIQIMIVPIEIPELEYVEDFGVETERGESGFHSTGK